MADFFNSPVGFYVTIAMLNILLYGLTILLHQGKLKVEEIINAKLSPDKAMRINDLLDLIERLTEAAVQDANSRIVIGLKTKRLFTPETAASVKQAVISDIMNNLGPLKDKAQECLGPLETIVGQLIEKHVMNGKDQVHKMIKAEESKGQ